MDDSCAVCADALEWVAYGACGHKEVCSTCVARLRFICEDRRCCICKSESDVVFVTKALGDYTRMINDFSVLPSDLKEGKVGSYWYHEDTQAFFDDVDHYKMIKAMCNLSCSVCDKMEGQPHDGSKRRAKFRNIEQLKGHLFHQHKLVMCSLCLEGRKVFICEQKLYSRAQLKQHISTGDSEVDGSESERGGFMGHPMCEFCRSPFYGENELYSHMSTEHYTCHICQRQHPGHYEYYKNYDDLEIHFRQEHFLCEDEACLAKKFTVFQSEGDLKRHNALEHGGRMSRSKRNAALQIPTSFRFRRNNEQDRRRGRGRTFQHDSSEDQLSMAIEASLETSNADRTSHDPSSLSNGRVAPDPGDASDIDPIIQPFESLATMDSEPSSRYLQALGHGPRNVALGETSFPPLPLAPNGSQQKPRQDSEGLPSNSMAAHLRRQRNVTVPNSVQAWPAASRGPVVSASTSTQSRPTTNTGPVMSRSSGQTNKPTGNGLAKSTYANLAQPRSTHAQPSAGSSRDLGNTGRMSHSTSAPDLVESGSVEPSISDFPPVSAAQMHKVPITSQALLNVEDVHTANRSLVEKMRAALEFDEDKYTAFKDISGQYRQGLIDTRRYLDYVQQFGLSHLVVDMARLCPDVQKQKELVEIYNASLRSNVPQGNDWGRGSAHLKDSKGSKKGKGKSMVAEDSNSKDILANSILSTVKQLQSSYNPSEQEAEMLSKDGYRASKGKSWESVVEQRVELNTGSQPLMKLRGQNDSPSAGSVSHQNIGGGVGGSKQRKKSSKFLRARLGDGSVASLLDYKNKDPDSDPEALDENPTGALPVRGVWRNGGGHKLFP
ncbi:E3 ubiquitin-protein ligase HEL2-like [Fagus crenata]